MQVHLNLKKNLKIVIQQITTYLNSIKVLQIFKSKGFFNAPQAAPYSLIPEI